MGLEEIDEFIFKEFLVEAYEKLDQIEQDVLALEGNPGDQEIINRVFRDVHTLKGNSGTLGLSRLEKLCHSGETVLDNVRGGDLSFTPEMATALLKMGDTLREAFKFVEAEKREVETDFSELIQTFNSFVSA